MRGLYAKPLLLPHTQYSCSRHHSNVTWARLGWLHPEFSSQTYTRADHNLLCSSLAPQPCLWEVFTQNLFSATCTHIYLHGWAALREKRQVEYHTSANLYACVCAYMPLHVHVHIPMHIHIHIHILMHMHMYLYLYLYCTCTCIRRRSANSCWESSLKRWIGQRPSHNIWAWWSLCFFNALIGHDSCK